jgi:glucokinase
VNDLLESAGNPKRYQNLFGITLGTGLGGGIVRRGELFRGDNSAAGEVWVLRNKLNPSVNAEEGASIRAVCRTYARVSGIPMEQAPEPKTIFDIALGNAEGNRGAALQAFRELGEVAGDAVAQALTLIDGLVVIGGGISGAWPLFLPSLVDAMNDVYETTGKPPRRLIPQAYNLEDEAQRECFLRSEAREIPVPGSSRKVLYNPAKRTAVGLSRLGTAEAVSIGAYAFALNQL